MKKLVVFACSILAVLLTHAQNAFEGKVVYDIDFSGSGLPQQALDMLKGAEAVTFIKASKRRVDINMPMQSSSSFVDSKKKTVTTVMEIMGQKYLIPMTKADLQKEEEKRPKTTISYTEEQKEIAGYVCKKATVNQKSADGKEDNFIVYYTTEIPTSEIKSIYPGLKGFPMEYTVMQGGIKMTFSAKSVAKEAIPDTKFDLPKEGYTKISMEDFKKQMEQLGAGG